MRVKLFTKVFVLFLLLSILPLMIVGARISLVNYMALQELVNQAGLQKELVYAIFDQTLREAVTYTIYVIIIVVIIAIFFTASIVGPVERLKRATKKLSRGEYSEVPEVRTGDELESLADSFRTMAERLRSTMEELEQANTQKRVFLDIMCHDLSNYVSIIGGFSTLLAEKETDPEKLKILGIINRNVRKIEEVLEDARRFARLEKGTAMNFRERNLREMFESVKGVFAEEQHRIKLKLPELHAEVDDLMEDVFLNLISNALKYSEHEVIVEGEERDGRVRIMVRDYGEGIPDEHKQLIFERFWRREKEGVRGVGLGLAIVKSIVEMHGGSIWVEDNSPKGSVFIVDIPKKQDAHADEQK